MVSGLLRETIQDRRIKDRPVVIRHISTKEELPGCHLLFISPSEKNRLPEILETLKGTSVLTVGEMDGFPEQGGMVNFDPTRLHNCWHIVIVVYNVNAVKPC